MSSDRSTETFLARLAKLRPYRGNGAGGSDAGRAGDVGESRESIARPVFSEARLEAPRMLEVKHPDGRMSQYPPAEHWDDWLEWDAKAWPRKVPRRFTLVPTICFNCESACGLLAYVDRETFETKRFEGNPAHPGSRGRNCAKGPATHNQVYDPERILYPLKRVGARGEGRWKRVTWDEALADIGAKMRASRQRRRDGIMYHVGRPGEDHFTNNVIKAWGVDGHNSHTNICSAGARAGYAFWSGADRPSPDHSRARVILLISAHLESGHYFNPHAQRIMDGKRAGAKIITMDPRLSNTAAKSDVWLPTWPGSEATVLLAFASALLRWERYDREFLRRWVNWQAFLEHAPSFVEDAEVRTLVDEAHAERAQSGQFRFEDFERVLCALYAPYTLERAACEAQVPLERLEEAARLIADAGDRLAAHTWRAATMGNRGGWQVARCMFFLNVLTGSVGTEGGTALNSWNKFVPRPPSQPDTTTAWNELHLPHEWPLAMYEMSFLLPHFLTEGRGDIDVYFTRVYNPMWINPDGFMWLDVLRDEEKIKLHVALTPTWNESAWFADYVLPMGLASERHDLMSQETHQSSWLGFRQPVRRVAMERMGKRVDRTWQANPGEVWEEAEFWIDLTWKMDHDGSLGIRRHFESFERPGEPITMDEYFGWVFEHSVPGLPAVAKKEGLTPLEYMRKYGAFEVSHDHFRPYADVVELPKDHAVTSDERVVAADGSLLGVLVDGVCRKGFGTPSRRLELFSPTLSEWGWPEQQHVIPWSLRSHVHPEELDRDRGEMILLPTFRLPTLIHTRSANAKWLYEISHKNPIWIHPEDAARLGVETGDRLRVETEIGWFVDKAWVTEGIKPGIVAMSHHLGRWRLSDAGGSGMFNRVSLEREAATGEHRLHVLEGARAWRSNDPDTSRVWWEDVGVHQNLTHAVHPDPISGAHCWHQKATVRKASDDEKHGDVYVDTRRSMEVYRAWHALARSAVDHSPDETRRPYWLNRPLKPTLDAYRLPREPFGRTPKEKVSDDALIPTESVVMIAGVPVQIGSYDAEVWMGEGI